MNSDKGLGVRFFKSFSGLGCYGSEGFCGLVCFGSVFRKSSDVMLGLAIICQPL